MGHVTRFTFTTRTSGVFLRVRNFSFFQHCIKNMDKNVQSLQGLVPNRTPLGGGKRTRRQQCKEAAKRRWQTKNAVKSLLSISMIGEATVTEHTISASGDANISNDLLAGDNSGIVELPAEQQCTARRKLNVMKDYVAAADETDNDKERCFLELKSLKYLVSAVACCECGGTLTVGFGDKMGYSREIRLTCEACTFTKQQYSCGRLDGSNNITVGFDVNNSIVMCFNELGCGEAALRKFSAIMSIPALSHKTYQRISKKVGGAHREVTANVLQAAVLAVHDAVVDARGDPDKDNSDEVCDAECAANDGDSSDSASVNSDDDNTATVRSDTEEDDNADVVDITVSFDGTWHKRGFTSNYGVGIVIDVGTGLVLDFEVLSKYCQVCTLNNKRRMSEEERADWRRDHKLNCEVNYEGSSKGMEKEAALRLWGRSVRRNNMRYTKMLSDGDSVAFKAVVDANLYPVEKLECVNHCDKRMGTALRKKAKEEKLGGRRRGALTANACTILQSYYRNAIMKNLGKPEKMKEAIWACFLHCSSTDDNPQHQKCPVGSDSWCFFLQAVAAGQEPPPHKDYVGTPLSAGVARAVKPIYDRMSDIRLMARIKHGRTQNANECLNGQIWARCPETVHVSASRVNAAVASAVSHFNQGCAHLSHVMKQLGVTPADGLKDYQVRQDQKRCIQADKVAQPERKRSRKDKKRASKSKTVQQERQEGQTYGPGMS